MARIPEEEIERLKREISVERLAVAKGVKLKKHGENLIGLCPLPAASVRRCPRHRAEEPEAR